MVDKIIAILSDARVLNERASTIERDDKMFSDDDSRTADDEVFLLN